MKRVSGVITNGITEHHTGESSGKSVRNSSEPTSSFKASVYYSPRIQRMTEETREFSSEVELGIENSKVHWSELSVSGSTSTGLGSRMIHKKRPLWGRLFKFFKVPVDRNIREDYTENADISNNTENSENSDDTDNYEHFEMLKQHSEWGGFFKNVKVVSGEKINEGAQAEIYDAKVEFEDGCEFDYVVKVMKGDNPLRDFQRQWPVGMLRNVSRGTDKDPLLWIKGGVLIDNRFAFVMVKQWGDLRKLIDLKKEQTVKKDDVIRDIGITSKALPSNQLTSQGPPFVNIKFIWKVMLCIAEDMERLHTRHGIVHRDLKASNILLWSLGEGLPDNNSDVTAHVADYECCVGVVGTGFWRAPEILAQLKNGVGGSELVFTEMSDVYGYGMICYEILTGCLPFEERSIRDYDYVLNGNRPKLPTWIKSIDYMIKMIQSCWDPDPSRRPTFTGVVATLRRGGSQVPPWWPTPEHDPMVSPVARARAQEASSLLLKDAQERFIRFEYRDSLKRQSGGFAFSKIELINSICIRRLCRDYGAGVLSSLDKGGRVDFYAAAIHYVFDICMRNEVFQEEGFLHEGIDKFIAGFGGNIENDVTNAAATVIDHVVKRTSAIFFKVIALRHEIVDARMEFEGLIRIHETFSPVENSQRVEVCAIEFKAAYPVETRRRVLEMYISCGGSKTEWLAREVLGVW